MAALSIRYLDDGVRDRLRVRAARNGRSMEAEVREILTEAATAERPGLVAALRQNFGALGGVELELPERTDRPRPAELGE